MEAAQGAGLRAIRYHGGNLDEPLAACLPPKT
jgi:hypothetical protein